MVTCLSLVIPPTIVAWEAVGQGDPWRHTITPDVIINGDRAQPIQATRCHIESVEVVRMLIGQLCSALFTKLSYDLRS